MAGGGAEGLGTLLVGSVGSPIRLMCAPTPNNPIGLLAVVARAGPQVGGVVIKPVAGHALVEAAVRVGVVVGDLKGVDDSVHVLLDLLGRGFYIRAFSHQGVLIRVLTGVRIDHGAGVSGAVAVRSFHA